MEELKRQITADLSETIQVRRQYSEMFKVFKEKLHQSRILDPVKMFFQYEGKIKIVPYKRKPKRVITLRTALQELLIVVIKAEGK